jgi:hypothetical protein
LQAGAPDVASLQRVREVVDVHLERFTSRDKLTISWSLATPATSRAEL